MSWVLFGAILAFLVALVSIWRGWIAPWRRIEEIIAVISRGETPSTFLLQGAVRPRRVGLALETLFKRQAQLDRQIAEQASGTGTVFAALQDGLLMVDPQRRVTFVNRTLQKLFASHEADLGRPILEVIRDPALDRLIGQ